MRLAANPHVTAVGREALTAALVLLALVATGCALAALFKVTSPLLVWAASLGLAAPLWRKRRHVAPARRYIQDINVLAGLVLVFGIMTAGFYFAGHHDAALAAGVCALLAQAGLLWHTHLARKCARRAHRGAAA